MELTNFKCQVHNVNFQYPKNFDEQNLVPPECPVCMAKRIGELTADLKKVTEDRRRLLDAFEVKRTVEIEEKCP